MKPLFFNRKSLLFATLLASAIGANAQIVSTHTDEKFNYTTVVYKDKAATDKDVLSALDNSIGMGDVIRVTVAPPKPAAAPTIDKSKGEDVWLKPASASINNLTATTTAAPIINKPSTTATLAPKTAPVAKAAPVAAKPIVKQVANTPKTAVVENHDRTEEKMAAAPKTIKTKSSVAAKSSKSSKTTVKKSTRKSSGSSKMKSRKKGKQRYGCPKF